MEGGIEMAFANLHLHTQYSLLDGACKIPKLIERLKALGQTACAVTDHGVLYGAVEFYTACKENGIHPVIGCEVYVCENMHEKQSFAREYSHLILLCENQIGYQNLSYLVSQAFTEGFYYKPRLDYKLLQEHSEGLIALSACLSGDLPKLLLEERYKDAKEYIAYMKKIMGENNFFIEIMDHGIHEEKVVLPRLIAIAEETDTKLVVTNDCHYLTREDAKAQEVLMCIQTGKTLDDDVRMRMQTQDLFVKSEEELMAMFPDNVDAIQRTQEIAMRCQVDFDFSTIHLPKFPVEGETAEELLVRMCEEGFARLYDKGNQVARKRMEYELGIIIQMGYVDYFLIVWDFIRYAKENDIMVGPGRGSGAGSIVAYCLSITGLDPLKYNLIFERFLNPERISMPDFDIDFCYERRQEVIDYVTRKYGQDHVCQIITFGTMAARGVIRDVGRVLGYSYGMVDQIAKAVPMELGITLEKALSTSSDLNNMVHSDPQIKKLYDMALALEGMPRHASTHAAGVLITKKPVTHYLPLQMNDQVVTTQFPMGIIEKLGLLKMDFLGLRTLTVIQDTLNLLKKKGINLHALDIPLDDSNVYTMISNGDTDGVFQLEGSGMRSFLTNMCPANFEDIIAAISLYRPGPMDSIPTYIKGKQDPSTVQYKSPLLKPILDVTYGCMVYQEQVMQVVRDLAGYSFGRSDLVRKAMAKKKKDVMAKERHIFVHGLAEDNIMGAVANGVPEKVAEEIFDEMTAFASYAFNKSHAAAYGMVAVQTAWLKCYYPVEFMVAMMNSVSGNASKVAAYIHYCKKKKIPILPPSVNHSEQKFIVDQNSQGEKGIRFGMQGVKNVGIACIQTIVAERKKKGAYRDIYDFCRRTGGEHINKRAVESLIKAGCFDQLEQTRTQCMAVYEKALDSQSALKKTVVSGQLSFFDMGQPSAEMAMENEYPTLAEYPKQELLRQEKEMTGVYVSGHPLDEYAKVLENISFNTAMIGELLEGEDGGLGSDGMTVQMGGIITQGRSKATKKGAMMGFITLEDLMGQVEGLLFPKVYSIYSKHLQQDSAVLITGKLSIREDEEPKLLVDAIEPLQTTHKPKLNDMQRAKLADEKLYLRMERAKMDTVLSTLRRIPGPTPVYINIPKENITLLIPRDLWVVDGEEAIASLLTILNINDMKVIKK